MASNPERAILDPGGTTVINADPTKLFAIGKHLLSTRQYQEALVALKEAVEQDPGEASYRSYYGLCLVESGRGRKEGLRLCREAVQQAFYLPDLYVNLVKAHLASGERRLAVAVLKTGASFEPENEVLQKLMSDVGRRRRPVFPFLRRGHPINRIAGRIRHALLGPSRGE
jgi:Flp pilus assembly protein TadD